MRNINDFNIYGTTGIDGVMLDLTERMDLACKAAMAEWYDADPRGTNAYSERGHSVQSESAYWTVGDDTFEFCVRIAAHKAVACVSKVHLNINIMDFMTTDGEWMIDYEAACGVVDAAASAVLESIA